MDQTLPTPTKNGEEVISSASDQLLTTHGDVNKKKTSLF